jgi:ferredoxin-NADP reductase
MAEFIQPATVLSSTNLTPHVRQLVVLPKEQPIVFKAGQWVSLKLPVGIKPPLNRAYSMAAPGTASGELILVLDRVPGGLGSNYLFLAKPGDELILSGPYGSFLLPPQIDRELLFVTRYTGLVPIRCMLLTLAVTHPGFRYLPLVAAGGEQQAVDLTLPMLRPLLQASPQVLPMLCGTKAFVKPLRAHFLEAGYDRKEVKTETYD